MDKTLTVAQNTITFLPTGVVMLAAPFCALVFAARPAREGNRSARAAFIVAAVLFVALLVLTVMSLVPPK